MKDLRLSTTVQRQGVVSYAKAYKGHAGERGRGDNLNVAARLLASSLFVVLFGLHSHTSWFGGLN